MTIDQAPCPVCGGLKDKEYGYSKFGHEEDDRPLPPAAARLVLVRDLRPGAVRLSQILACPLCGTRYHYETDYEYLVNGSEDSETLTRLDPEAAQALDRT